MPTSVDIAGADVRPLLAHAGRVLRQAREQQGLTLEDMAARTQTSKSQIANFETQTGEMTFGRVLRLASALGVNFADLVPPEEPSILARILLLAHARGPDFADRLLAILEVPPACLPRRRSR